MIVVDSSEAKVAKSIIKKIEENAIPVVVKSAPADFVFIGKENEVVCFERSTGGDFVSKVLSKRLWKQLDSELSECDVLYYVIENPYAIRKTVARMKNGKAVEKAVLGALATVADKARVVIAFNKDEVATLIVSKYRKMALGKKVYIGGRATSKMSVEDEAINVLMGIRGVGRNTAVKMLSAFGSLKAIANASIGELIGVVGSKLGTHVHEVFNYRKKVLLGSGEKENA